MANGYEQFFNNPLVMLGANMMRAADPRMEGLGGLGAGISATGETMRQRAQLAEESERARMLADLQMREYQSGLEQQQAEQERLQAFAAQNPQLSSQILAGQMPTDFQRKMQIAGGDPARYREMFGPGAGAQVDIKLPEEITEEQKVVGKYYGQQFTQLMDAEKQARAQNAKLERLDQLFDEAYTGIGGKEVQSAKRALQILGFDTEGVGEAEAAQSLSAEMALQLRNPGGGAGMPGAMSDKDREFLQSMIPGLATTSEGRTLMVETKKKLNQRSIEVAKMAREYRRQFGRLDENFYDQLAAYSDANPMFEEEAPQVMPTERPQPTGFKIIGVSR